MNLAINIEYGYFYIHPHIRLIYSHYLIEHNVTVVTFHL